MTTRHVPHQPAPDHIPGDVLDALEAARLSGEVDMHDRPSVIRLINGTPNAPFVYPAASVWLTTNPGQYDEALNAEVQRRYEYATSVARSRPGGLPTVAELREAAWPTRAVARLLADVIGEPAR